MTDHKDLTFLVVDDDGQVRDILVGYLKSFGFENIIEAKDGRAALKVIQNHHQRIDFVISDWEMPHVDGLTLLRAVRRDPDREYVKFIMVTSQGSRERLKISKAAKSRVDAYVVKPFRGHLLREKIDTLLKGGIDKSVDEFEEALMREVPHNDGSISASALGKVIVEKDPPKGEGIVKAMMGKASGVGNVTHQERAPAPTGTVQGPAPDGAPPADYDLTQMNVQLILKLAKSYVKVGWFAKAVELCTKANALFPDNMDILYQLAYSYYMQGDHEGATAELQKILAVQRYHSEALTLISEIKSLHKVA